jgi:hypothetical protein
VNKGEKQRFESRRLPDGRLLTWIHHQQSNASGVVMSEWNSDGRLDDRPIGSNELESLLRG